MSAAPTTAAEAEALMRRNQLRFLRTIFPETPLSPEEAEDVAANLLDGEPLTPERISEIVEYATRPATASRATKKADRK